MDQPPTWKRNIQKTSINHDPGFVNERDVGFHVFVKQTDARKYKCNYFINSGKYTRVCKVRVKGFNRGGYHEGYKSETWKYATVLKVYP